MTKFLNAKCMNGASFCYLLCIINSEHAKYEYNNNKIQMSKDWILKSAKSGKVVFLETQFVSSFSSPFSMIRQIELSGFYLSECLFQQKTVKVVHLLTSLSISHWSLAWTYCQAKSQLHISWTEFALLSLYYHHLSSATTYRISSASTHPE